MARSATTTIAHAPAAASGTLASPIPAVKSSTAATCAPDSQSTVPSSRSATSITAAGAATSALRCSGTASASAYAVAMPQRALPVRPARSAASNVSITSSSALAYTSVSVALDHTVNMPPAHNALASAIGSDPVARATSAVSSPPAAAVHIAENRFVASAVLANGSASAQVRASTT